MIERVGQSSPEHTENLENAQKFVERTKIRIEAGQLTNSHLSTALDHLAQIAGSVTPSIEKDDIYQLKETETKAPLQTGLPEIGKTKTSKKEEESDLPKITIYEQQKKATIGSKKARFKTGATFDILLAFADNPQRQLGNKKINKILKTSNCKSKVGDIISHLRHQLGNNQIITCTKRQEDYFYTLNANIELIREPVKITNFKKEITGLTPKECEIVQILSTRRKENPVHKTIITSQMYPDVPYPIAKHRVHALISSLKIKLLGQGTEIINVNPIRSHHGAAYYLSPIEQPQDTKDSNNQAGIKSPDEDFQPQIEEQTAIVSYESSPDQLTDRAQKIESAPTFVPYTASEEEKRSTEETRTLLGVVKSIRPNKKIDFEAMQKGLYSQDSIIEKPTGPEIIIKQDDEIIKVFESAFGKLREEAAIPSLRSKWTEEDQLIWQQVQDSVDRLAAGNITDYIRKIKREIRKSQRTYFGQYPPAQGGTVFSIKL